MRLPLDQTADVDVGPLLDGLAVVAGAASRGGDLALAFDPGKGEELTLRTLGEVFVFADAAGSTSLEGWLDYACNLAYVRVRAPEPRVAEALAALVREHLDVLDRGQVLRAARKKRRHPRDVARLALVARDDNDEEVFTLLTNALAAGDLAARRGAIHAMKLLGWPAFAPALDAAAPTVEASLHHALAEALAACRR